MDGEKIVEYARALYNAHGDKAEAEAAQKAQVCDEAGKADEAQDWRAIRTAIKEMRGAKQT